MAVAKSPSGPAPWITTVCRSSIAPRVSKALITVRSAQDAADAQPSATPSGTLTRPLLGQT